MSERFHAQFELAEYLIELGDLRSARAELLVAAADAPVDAGAATMIGQRFEQANDSSNALKFYEKAIKLDPKDMEALNGAQRALDQRRGASPAEDMQQ